MSECGYDTNMRALGEAHTRPLELESTRSHSGEDSWRDMDRFDLDEELSRLRRAVEEVRLMNPGQFKRHKKWIIRTLSEEEKQKALKLLAFIAMAFDNIDENLVRLGPLPKAWMGSSSVTKRK